MCGLVVCRLRILRAMLARYKMYRGIRPKDDPLPDGVRLDTRKHTTHFLRPTPSMVQSFLDNPQDANWLKFESSYLSLLQERYDKDSRGFDKLAQLASQTDVYIGCSCPTKKNPNVNHCHTVLALRFMQERYARLRVAFP